MVNWWDLLWYIDNSKYLVSCFFWLLIISGNKNLVFFFNRAYSIIPWNLTLNCAQDWHHHVCWHLGLRPAACAFESSPFGRCCFGGVQNGAVFFQVLVLQSSKWIQMVVLLTTCSYSMFQIFWVFLLVWELNRPHVLANLRMLWWVLDRRSLGECRVCRSVCGHPKWCSGCSVGAPVVHGAQFCWFRSSIIGLTQ